MQNAVSITTLHNIHSVVVVDPKEDERNSATMSMFVVKRSGKKESVHFDKITSRISKLCYGLDAKVCTDIEPMLYLFLAMPPSIGGINCRVPVYTLRINAHSHSLTHSFHHSMSTPLSFRKR
jgi:hypothetical protein